jgi:hypothetical protein
LRKHVLVLFLNFNHTPLLFGEVKYLNLLICTQSPSRLTLINAYACIRVDLPDGTYTLTQEGDGTVELNQIGVQQDLDQSPEEPKASVSVGSEEGKHRFI